MEWSKLKDIIQLQELEIRKECQKISDYIYNTPELGGEEYQSSLYLAKVMEEHGFLVTLPYKGIQTAFRAEFGDSDGPTIAFLAEYDALPGYDTPSGNGHACGHNWIAATMCGCAIALSKLKPYFKGRIILMGTPAEETYGAKVNLIEAEAFNDIDIVFQAHLESETVINSVALAMNTIQFEFTGRAAHAASYPEDGINALDAVQLMFMGINSLRQHIKSDARIHGIITEGGIATNIVPERGVCKITMRSMRKKYLEHLVSRVIDCANGAALITGTQVKYEDAENKFEDFVNVPTLIELTKKNLEAVGINKIIEPEDAPPPGSTDLGNVSYKCPVLYLEVDLEGKEPLKVHEADALNYVNSEYAYKKMTQVIVGFVMSAMELYNNPQLINEIKSEHHKIIEQISA